MEALIGKNYWGFFQGELGSLITAGQSNGGGVGGWCFGSVWGGDVENWNSWVWDKFNG